MNTVAKTIDYKSLSWKAVHKAMANQDLLEAISEQIEILCHVYAGESDAACSADDLQEQVEIYELLKDILRRFITLDDDEDLL